MNGKRAKEIRRKALELSDNTDSETITKKKRHWKGFIVERYTRKWKRGSFMRIYRDLKKAYTRHEDLVL